MEVHVAPSAAHLVKPSSSTTRTGVAGVVAMAVEDVVGRGEGDSRQEMDRMQATLAARTVSSRDQEKARRLRRELSPERDDPYANTDHRTYASVLQEAKLEREAAQIQARIAEIERMNALSSSTTTSSSTSASSQPLPGASSSSASSSSAPSSSAPSSGSGTGTGTKRKRSRPSRWGPAPSTEANATETLATETLAAEGAAAEGAAAAAATAAAATAEGTTLKKRKTRWGAVPTQKDTTAAASSTTTTSSHQSMGEQRSVWTDADLDKILPSAGYEVLEPPEGYVKKHPGAKGKTVAVAGEDGVYHIPGAGSVDKEAYGVVDPVAAGVDVPSLKPDDYTMFAAILGPDGGEDEEEGSGLSKEEVVERKILRLLLRIKNGTPQQRKGALRSLTDKAEEFGAGPLFSQILPLFLSPSLEDVERHLLVKVVDRVLYKVKDGVRPFVHKILVVIEPLLVDEDKYARIEGREVISNLAKAAGLPCMIANMRPDIDHSDPFVRDVTAKAVAVVAVAVGVDVVLPFVAAVCESSVWQARHTGVKIVQQLAILQGVGILPYLSELVSVLAPTVRDNQPLVRNVSAMALAALAEASAPYGIDAFDPVLKDLWEGITMYSGRTLAAFLKAIGHIIPLMEPEHANYYTRELMVVLVRHFSTNMEDMKQVVLKVLEQTISADGVPVEYVREEILPLFFESFWVRRNAVDKRNYGQLLRTTVAVAAKVGGVDVYAAICGHMKDEMEPFRRMAVEGVMRVVREVGVDLVGVRLEERIMDGLVLAFQGQGVDASEKVYLQALAEFIVALDKRVRPYLDPIFEALKWRLDNASPHVRQQAADLVAAIAEVVMKCDEEVRLARMGVILFENLGEEYPDVLGSILGALDAIVSVIGMTKMTPPIRDLLPRLTPILRNVHEKVQEHCIYLVGRIADRGARFVSGREWMRICFDLLELLKASRKSTRIAAVSTFGFIAKAIGPQDVLATLLANLKVQDRQMRVCTTVAIAIVAETCSPFTVLPALMNEYRVPELNVQNGVLKALAFMFEYVGEMGKDYIYAVTSLITSALTDRDLVHRQTAATIVRNLAIGVYGLSCEDAVTHLLNHLWPNILETSPHVIDAVMEGVFACRLALGGPVILQYTLQGLFHPARAVRRVYWRIYNEAYIANPDAMVPAYPVLSESELGPIPVKARSKGVEASICSPFVVFSELDFVM